MSGRANLRPALRPFLPADVPLLVEIFRASIEELTADDYSELQQEEWASAADDEEAFGERLANSLTLIATLDGSAVGFISVEDSERIDMLYVHPAMVGQGIGTMLVDAVEKLATARGTPRLIVDASDSARSFFEHRSFVAQRRNAVRCGEEWLANTTMEKRLTPESRVQ